jgi:hypothetical protein
MAPPPILPNIFRCGFLWENGTQTAANVMHFFSADETTLFGHLNANVTAGMWGMSPSTARIATVTITQLDNASATQEFATTGAHWAGSQVTGDYDPAVALLISFKTGTRGLASHGRIYLPFIESGGTTTGTIGTGAETPLQTSWAAFVAAMSGVGSPLHIASYGVYRETDPGPPPVFETVKPPTSKAVTTVDVKQALATQRRRQDRVRVGLPTLLLLQAQLEKARPKKAQE